MTVVGLDDTDSREGGLCTTYVASRVAARLEAQDASVTRRLLVRCNPAVEYKTRGNAALAIHTDADSGRAADVLAGELAAARTDDPRTNPGGIVVDDHPDDISEAVETFAERAVRERLDLETARALADRVATRTVTAGSGRGLIGALAAVGAWRAFDTWTYECISYRQPSRWGTPRDVDAASVFDAADAAYPAVWDTVDRVEATTVCVPSSPCPVLHGIRGDDSETVQRVASAIESEPVDERALFVTNQGTDAHLQQVPGPAAVRSGRSYRLTATVTETPETRPGGHVFLAVGTNGAALDCVAFEPTKRFRDHVRSLRVGDRVTVCGEVTDDTLKLEKFALREATTSTLETPTCPACGRSMTSAGRAQGYRCRDCGTDAEGKVRRPIERDLQPGWYEVPPCARRHVAKPLVRGGFDAPIHAER